ncbi:hypothetical protein ABDK00_016825 [Niabella insulamsoli]|uniref:hypothetical protein n=1 Tax=Niabella insulamsoli TaxID=3144874 RepID=UPI0031FBF9ED
MKLKLLTLIFLLPLFSAAQLTIDTSKLTKSDFISFLSNYQVAPTKPAEPQTPVETGAIESFVDAFYTASSVVTDKTGAVVGIKALKGKDINYTGIASPTLIKPYQIGNEVVFTNQPNANYSLLTRPNGNFFPLPEEQTIVFRKLPGTDWEAIVSGWGNYYIGFGSINDLRAMTSDLYFKNKIDLQYFTLNFLHLRFEDAGSGKGKAKAWLNGDYIGEVTTSNSSWSRRLGYGVGIETNSADFNWLASMFIERGLTDAERERYFNQIEAAYPIGSLPNHPYASNISFSNRSGRLIPSYEYNGANPEDKSRVEFQWWKLSPDLSNQKLISTDASIATQSGVKVCVKVTDVKGNTWMFVSGNYK